jgi:hypothetical protein
MGVGALHRGERGANSRVEIGSTGLERPRGEVLEDLGVRLGGKLVPLRESAAFSSSWFSMIPL